MESNDKKTEIRIRIAMVIISYLAIILLLVVIIIVVKNINEIKDDPISYGINKKGFVFCSCYDNDGKQFSYNSTGVVPTKAPRWDLDFSDGGEIIVKE